MPWTQKHASGVARRERMTRSFEAWKYSAMRSRTSKRRLDATEVEVPPLGSLLPARTLKTDCRAVGGGVVLCTAVQYACLALDARSPRFLGPASRASWPSLSI